MNHVTLIGRLTKDVDYRNTGTTNVAKFSLAIDRPKKDGQDQGADFIPCTAFGKTADALQQYVGKGRKIAVEGRIQTGSYTKQDGTKAYTTDVIVNTWEFCDAKPQAPAQPQQYAPQGQYQPQAQPQYPPQGQYQAPPQAPAPQPAPQYQQQTWGQPQFQQGQFAPPPQQAPAPQYQQAAADGFVTADPLSDEGLPFMH